MLFITLLFITVLYITVLFITVLLMTVLMITGAHLACTALKAQARGYNPAASEGLPSRGPAPCGRGCNPADLPRGHSGAAGMVLLGAVLQRLPH